MILASEFNVACRDLRLDMVMEPELPDLEAVLVSNMGKVKIQVVYHPWVVSYIYTVRAWAHQYILYLEEYIVCRDFFG